MKSSIYEEKATLPDERIIGLYWIRDENAIKETEEKYGKFLYKIAFNILGDKFDSEECKNDTYMGIWNAIPPTVPTVFQSFIAQIARRISINKYNEKRRKNVFNPLS